ncbi:MAG: hypothetical protein HOO67_04130 [Candidatus Peribacteraceae bacterium]|nr:hypothetical protein [Candidatus Peribacteraceae bacterium]
MAEVLQFVQDIQLPERLPAPVQKAVTAVGNALHGGQPHASLVQALNRLQEYKDLPLADKNIVREYLQKRVPGETYQVLFVGAAERPDINIVSTATHNLETIIGHRESLHPLPPRNLNVTPPAWAPKALTELARTMGDEVRRGRSPFASLQAINKLEAFRTLTRERKEEFRETFLQPLLQPEFQIQLTDQAAAKKKQAEAKIKEVEAKGKIAVQDSVDTYFLSATDDRSRFFEWGDLANEAVGQQLRRRLFPPNGAMQDPIVEPGRSFTLVDVQRYRAYLSRRQSIAITNTANEEMGKGRQPPGFTNVERREMIAERLHATYAEQLGNAMSLFVDMAQDYEEQYESARSEGVVFTKAFQAKHKLAGEHMTAVHAVSRRMVVHELGYFDRIRQPGFNLAKWSATPEAVKWRAERQEMENELARLMACEVAPFRNEHNVPPVYDALLDLTMLRYTHILSRANKETLTLGAGMAKSAEQARLGNEARSRIFHANTILLPQLQKQGGTLTSGRADGMFQIEPSDRNPDNPNANAADTLKANRARIEKLFINANFQTRFPAHIAHNRTTPYAYADYERDFKTYEAGAKSAVGIFQELGRDLTGHLADWLQTTAEFQAARAEHTTIQHQFAQLARLSAAAPNSVTPGAVPDAELQSYRKVLRQQQVSGVRNVREQMRLVRTEVAVLGIDTTIENFWNGNMRPLFEWFADRIVAAQTILVPRALGLRQAARDRMVGEIPNLIGWPRYTDADIKEIAARGEDVTGLRAGEPKQGQHLSKAEREYMEKRQKSVASAINTFNETHVLDHCDQSSETVETLINLPDLDPEDLFQIATDIQTGRLNAGEYENTQITPQNLPKLWAEANADQKRQLIVRCFDQLRDSLREFGPHYRTLLTDIHDVIGMHIHWERAAYNFAEGQSWWLILLILGIGGGLAIGSGIGFALGRLSARRDRKNNARIAELERMQREQGTLNQQLQEELRRLRLERDPRGVPPEAVTTPEERQRLLGEAHRNNHHTRMAAFERAGFSFEFRNGGMHVQPAGVAAGATPAWSITIGENGAITAQTGTPPPEALRETTAALETLNRPELRRATPAMLREAGAINSHVPPVTGAAAVPTAPIATPALGSAIPGVQSTEVHFRSLRERLLTAEERRTMPEEEQRRVVEETLLSEAERALPAEQRERLLRERAAELHRDVAGVPAEQHSQRRLTREEIRRRFRR